MDKPRGKACFAYWICKCECGRYTSVRSDHLKDGTTIGCGCGNSIGEFNIDRLLEKNGHNYKRQYSFPDLKVQSYLRFDFAIFNEKDELIALIEYQGEQHYKKYNFDTEERFNKRLEYDEIKREYCRKNNIKLIEIPYTDLDLIDIEYLRQKIGV